MEQLTGIYAELAFLDVALNFGQSLIAFAIFGLDPSLGKLGGWLQKICRKWQSGMICMTHMINFIFYIYAQVHACKFIDIVYRYQNKKYYINLYPT